MKLKAKILAGLKTKYKNLGFSDKVLEGVADMLAATTTEEDQIDTAVDGVESLLKGFQSDTDTRVTAAVNKAKAEIVKPETQNPSAPSPEPPKADPTPTPDFAKAIQDALSPLVKEINELKSGNVSQNRQQTLASKLEKANPAYKATVTKAFNRMTFQSDDDFNAFLLEVEEGMGEFDQNMADQGLGSNDKPLLGVPNASGISVNTQKYIDSKKAEAQKDNGLQGKQVFS